MAVITLTPDDCKKLFDLVNAAPWTSLVVMKKVVAILEKLNAGQNSTTGFTLTTP